MPSEVNSRNTHHALTYSSVQGIWSSDCFYDLRTPSSSMGVKTGPFYGCPGAGGAVKPICCMDLQIPLLGFAIILVCAGLCSFLRWFALSEVMCPSDVFAVYHLHAGPDFHTQFHLAMCPSPLINVQKKCKVCLEWWLSSNTVQLTC